MLTSRNIFFCIISDDKVYNNTESDVIQRSLILHFKNKYHRKVTLFAVQKEARRCYLQGFLELDEKLLVIETQIIRYERSFLVVKFVNSELARRNIIDSWEPPHAKVKVRQKNKWKLLRNYRILQPAMEALVIVEDNGDPPENKSGSNTEEPQDMEKC